MTLPVKASSKLSTRYNFHKETPPGKDPDSKSPTLRRYHKALWSRELPGGQVFELRDDVPKKYLSHESELGSFEFSSDALVPTYSGWSRMEPIVSQSPLLLTIRVQRRVSTIGGRMIWPSKNVPGAGTINGRRGFDRKISDRADLSLECVRRFYLGDESPLSVVLESNAAFFGLFENFNGFVEFFLLQDLVESDRQSIRFMLPFFGFEPSGLPKNLDEYMQYMKNADAFVKARNKRISALNISVAG